ncbi:plasmid replication protein RepC [Phyllobacterium myrsinacearum]|uniref:Replication initiation protein RepC n=1 Tax=Phyllobacterium myrsinacearum TaxID=28101 RepID=A0A839ESI8_9HYPH|nr:plasmid replication protein RepC [Phyllobacterium myrsinacearum]MBA8881762.1 replication initiation protein RepC [Phyllobacterium myrsinacearum]
MDSYVPEDAGTKKDLFESAHLAAIALGLRPSARSILSQLVGFFREPINGLYLVWPSNEFLSDRTGLSDRAIRYAIGELIRAGVILARDSANGKRFAVRSKQGQILDAYGFNLSPLLARKDELQARTDAIREFQRARMALFDQITICRRAAQEALYALSALEMSIDTSDLQAEYERLVALSPRRTSSQPVEPVLSLWQSLKTTLEDRYNAACGGKNSRLIENNKDSPDQSCNKRQRDNESEINLPDLCAACPDAFGYVESVGNDRELLSAAAGLRGAIGIHRSAWDEAMEKIGPLRASAAFFVVLEIYSADQSGEMKIKNPGGYFRNYVRMIESGQIDLAEVIRYMRRKKAH